MLNSELEISIDEMKSKLKKYRFYLRKNEGMEYLTIIGIAGLIFISDIDAFIRKDGYQDVAFVIDTLLASGTLVLGQYILKDENRKEELKSIKEKLVCLNNIKEELNKGINRYEVMSKESFTELFDILYLEQYHPELITKEYVENKIVTNEKSNICEEKPKVIIKK